MFYGEYEHTLDKKGRLILPSKIRDAAKANYIEKFYITRGLDNCLFMIPEEEWKAQEIKLKSIPFTKSQSRKFNRLYFSGAQEVEFDKQGRILIPRYLKEFAGIKHSVMIIGVSSRIEIWDMATWKEFYNSERSSFEKIAEDLLDTEKE